MSRSVYHMSNLPDAKTVKPDQDVVGIVNSENSISLVAGGWVICDIRIDHSPAHIADQIAIAVRKARDRGFNQGVKFIRDSLNTEIQL